MSNLACSIRCLPIWLVIASLIVGALLVPASAQDPAGDRTVIHGQLTLAAAMKVGVRENLTLRAAQADARAASADVSEARSMTLPQLSANSYLTTGDAANIVSSSPNVTPVSYMSVPSKAFADQNLTLMAPIYTGGRLQALVRAASDRASAANSMVGGSTADVALGIKVAYDRILLASELVDVAQARFKADTEMLRNVTDRYDAGKDIIASVNRAQAELADAQRELTSAQNDQAKAFLDLRAAMGVNLDSDFTTSDSLVFTPPTGDLTSFLLQAARSRPELLAAQSQASAAGHDVTAARGSLQPQVYGLAMADAFAAQSMPSGKGGTVGLTISFPLFDAGQRRAEIARASANRDRQVAGARNMALTVSNEVRQAWLDVQTAAQNYATAESALQATQSSYDVISMRVQAQKGILVEQLDALTALTRAQANRAQALYDHAVAVARLERSVGIY